MGRPMEANIHNPSVGGQAANTSSASASNGTSSRDRILALMKRKDALEAEISALSAVLDTHGANMQTPLTTFDGYPRDDIDVAQIRTTRARIIPLVNDVKALMIEIEKALHAHHAEPTGTSTSADSSSTSAAPPTTAPQTETPVIEAVFAVVDQVSPSSPAEQAGVQVGDKVKRFGSVGALNHEKLAKVAAEVQQNENVRPSSFPQLHAACRLVGRVLKLTTTTHAYYSANHIGSGVPCDWRWGAGSGAAVDTSTRLGWSRDAGMSLASIIIVPPCRLPVASFGCIGTPVVFLDRTGLA